MPHNKDKPASPEPHSFTDLQGPQSGVEQKQARISTDAPEPQFSRFAAKKRSTNQSTFSEEERLVHPVFVPNPVPAFDKHQEATGGLNAADQHNAPDDNSGERMSAPSVSYVPTSSSPLGSAPPQTRGALHPLDDALLDTLDDAFSTHARSDGELSVDDLQTALGIENPLLALRLLQVLDQDGDGVVTRTEFLDRVRRLLYGSATDKLRFAFRIHDLNGDNLLARGEMCSMIRASLSEEGKLHNAHDAAQLTELVFGEADKNRDGYISYREFEAAVSKYPGVLETITRCEACWIAPNQDILKLAPPKKRLVAVVGRWLSNRWQVAVVLALWVGANLSLGILAALRYQSQGANELIMLARASGACLNFNGALILIPVMRRLLTKVRSNPGLSVIPVDDAIAFHRLVGHSMFALAIVHAGAHLANYHASTLGISTGLFGSSAGLTGLSLLVVFSVMWIGALPVVRRTNRFELFYFSHLLYVAWLALFLVHGPAFYLWVGVPLVGFGVEAILRKTRRGHPCAITSIQPHSSGVTSLTLTRPPGFIHHPGDYAFLRIPSLARHEWHPFTISSAPEKSDLSMHVRSLGDFTKALRDLAEERLNKGQTNALTAHLDGPYGTPSMHIFESKNVVLVGAGIGVTPFAAVLESIVLRAKDGSPGPQKVHFFWLNRDGYSFEWFADLLMRLEAIDKDHLVDIHIYMTGGRGHLSSAALNFARAISH